MVQEPQVREGVLDLAPLVEAKPAQNLVRDVSPHQLFFERPRLSVGTEEDRDPVRGALAAELLENSAGVRRLLALVVRFVKLNALALRKARDQVLALAVDVVPDHTRGRAQNGGRRAVVDLELHHARPGEVALEVENVPQVGAAEVVDRLVLVAHHEEVSVGREKTQESILHAVRVLVLVHQHVAESSGRVGTGALRALEELDSSEKKVIEVDGARGFESALICLRRLREDRIDELAVVPSEGAVLLGRYRRRHAGERILALEKPHLPQAPAAEATGARPLRRA